MLRIGKRRGRLKKFARTETALRLFFRRPLTVQYKQLRSVRYRLFQELKNMPVNPTMIRMMFGMAVNKKPTALFCGFSV